MSDREYFRWAQANPGDQWFVSRPLVSRGTGEMFVDFSRRRSLPDGGFAGVLSVSLYPSYFADFYRELSRREPGLAVALVRADGVVIARWPDPPTLDATLSSSSPLLAEMSRGVPLGETRGRSSIDGKERLVSFRRIDGLPLYVAASLDRPTIVAGWARQVALLSAFVLPLSMCLAYVSWLALRRAERETAAVRRFRAEVEQRTRAEEALRQAQKLEALGQLTGGVAHDFNNLLMVINSNAHLLRRLTPGAADSRELGAIRRAVDAGSKLTRQLLAFARRQPLQPAPIDVQEAVSEFSELVRTVVGRAVTVTATSAVDVPPIVADRAELELALLNLAVNARDAMPDGGRLAMLARRAAPEEVPEAGGRPFVALSVSDTGQGIPPEALSRVFEPFFTTKQPGRGTGLGLAQVYGFAAQSGGTARIESEPGSGTTVTIYLPASDTGALPTPAGPAGELPALRGRVLLVEDNLEIAEATLPLLRSFGCEAEHVPSGDAALALIEREPTRFDAVLSDVVMPGAIDGLALALALRGRHPRLPVVLMTGYAAEIHHALAEGFDVLPKPCGPEALAEAIGRGLARSRSAAATAG